MESKRDTPLGSLVLGAVAGAVGTGGMDLFMYVRYKRSGGEQGFREWELSSGLDTWEEAPAPAQVGKRLVEGLLQRELPPSAAAPTTTVVHWGYGIGWGALYGLVAASVSSGRSLLGIALGPTVWASGYITLPLLKLYKPIWEYDFATLAKDLSAHAVYGAGTAFAFSLLNGGNDR